MTAKAATPTLTRQNMTAFAVRTFGWGMLAALLAFLLNNMLVVSFHFPGLRGLLQGEGGTIGWVHPLIYFFAIAVSLVGVSRISGQVQAIKAVESAVGNVAGMQEIQQSLARARRALGEDDSNTALQGYDAALAAYQMHKDMATNCRRNTGSTAYRISYGHSRIPWRTQSGRAEP